VARSLPRSSLPNPPKPREGSATRHQIAAILLLLLPLCDSSLAGAAQGVEPLRVFVSVLPQKTFVEKVGGDRVQVEAMVQPGDSPHTYDPTPRQVAALARADLYVAIGGTFEDAWMGRIRGVNPKMQVLDTGEGIALRPIEAHADADGHGADGHDHEHGPSDPHLWTSPLLVKQMALRIRDSLSGLDPANAALYATNAAAFAAELDALDRDIRARLAGVAGSRFMVYHPAWGYFADTYGLIQIPIEHEGKEPGPRALAALIDQARRDGVRLIFVQPQFSRKAAAQVAAAIGGRVEVVDNLAADYAANLRRVADALAQTGRP
jgi:zinc transport system substrate-binding protein